EREYDLAGLTIPKEEIHTLLPRDAIPALTDPPREAADRADWLPDDARIIVVRVGREVLGVPLRILNWHEIVNTTVGGKPISATYCPLCDSATVFSREVKTKRDAEGSGPAPSPVVLEFGVSGALYNSNVLMYDTKDRGLWSQLAMGAVSGPMAGTPLDVLPIELIPFGEFKRRYLGAEIVSRETGHTRDYSRSPYERYFADDSLLVPVAGVGDAMPAKTLGVGILAGSDGDRQAIFVTADRIGERLEVATESGPVVLTTTDAGIVVQEAPDSVSTSQTFYYAWSAFFPDSQIIGDGKGQAAEPQDKPGLRPGQRAPDVRVTAIDGSEVSLADLYRDGPIVLMFYRGGWCPICTRDLSAWAGRIQELKDAGATLVALTPERPDLAAKTRTETGAGYRVFSDQDHAAAKAFRVHFKVDDETRRKYEQFGLKVTDSNVSGTWELPAPAAFVIDRNGVVRWVFADWDYRKRADPDEVINAVRSIRR
ncbi:MAG: DUF3179 domain-containing protein, partial [Phycisphaerales bacterium]